MAASHRCFTAQVLFKMFLGSSNLGEAAHFFSTLGFFNLVFISCVPLVLYFTKVEHWGSLSTLPWGYLCGVAGLWLGESHGTPTSPHHSVHFWQRNAA